MIKLKKITSILIISILNCYASIYSQELILEDGMYFRDPKPNDGIWVEKPNKKDTTKYKYSKNNLSYKVGREFIYDYYFMDKFGVKKRFLLSKNEISTKNPLNLTSYNNNDDTTIEKIRLAVTDAKETYPACTSDSTCTQTVISYSYLTKNKTDCGSNGSFFKSKKTNQTYCSCGAVATGIYDNKKNIWMHPPRQYTFKILQLNPFPFYQLDETIKNWAWNVEVGGAYLDNRWVKTKENIKVRYDYERQNDQIIETAFGNLNCKVTNAIGSSHSENFKMKTILKSYYHPEYGFVRLEYKNIDGSKIIIQLVEVSY
jgi:hypothetical protein